MAQSSATGKKPRGPGRPFQAGRSGNPGGQAKGLSKLAREITNDGKDLIEFAASVLQGKKPTGVKRAITMADRQWAWDRLSDRGWGKAPQALEIGGRDGAKEIIFRVVHEGADA